MNMSWNKVTFTPDKVTEDAIIASWMWLIQNPVKPLLFSILGDMFFAKQNGAVYWLNTGAGEITLIADSEQQFKSLLNTDIVETWFLPELICDLYKANKIPKINECYTYVTLPILSEGKYEVLNLNPVPASEHFALTSDIHQQILDLPDGTKIQLIVVP